MPIVMPVDRANANYHPVQALAQDRAGRLWVSVVRGGSFRLDGDKRTRVGDAALALTAGAEDSVARISGEPDSDHRSGSGYGS